MRSVVAVVLGEEVSHEMRVKEGVVAEVEQNLHQVGSEEEEEEEEKVRMVMKQWVVNFGSC